jgi:peptide/nickel transport system permease protein
MADAARISLVRAPALPRVSGVVRANPIGALGAGVIVVLVCVAIAAPLLAPFDPTAQIATPLQAPDHQFVLGTDEFGRDILSRLLYGARISLYVGCISVGIGLIFGGGVGILSGYFGGRLEAVLMRIVECVFAFPSLLLAIAISGILGASLTHAMLAIGIVLVPTYARLARGSVLSIMSLDYISAARALGAGHRLVIGHHVLPNIVAPLVIQTTLSLSGAILTEASLSFLGLGTQPPDPSWGTMLGAGRRYMETAPWVALAPGMAITFTVLGFNLLGDGIRDFLDPTLRAG